MSYLNSISPLWPIAAITLLFLFGWAIVKGGNSNKDGFKACILLGAIILFSSCATCKKPVKITDATISNWNGKEQKVFIGVIPVHKNNIFKFTTHTVKIKATKKGLERYNAGDKFHFTKCTKIKSI